MKSFIAALAAASLLAVTPAMPEKAEAQILNHVCIANSPSAEGWGISSLSFRDACRRAVYQCALRTPQYQTCYVTRYFYD